MTDEEYREFMAVLVRRHVQPRLPRLRRRFHHHMMEEWHYHLDQAERSLQHGLLVSIFLKERRIRLEIGHGLERAIPDDVASRIIRETIAPRFREGNHSAGLQDGLAAVFERVRATRVAPEPQRVAATSPSSTNWLPIVGLLVLAAGILSTAGLGIFFLAREATMPKTMTGLALVALGVVALAVVYSLRPPAGIMDAFAMMARGRETFIRSPMYEIGLALSAVVIVFGALLVYLGLFKRSATETTR